MGLELRYLNVEVPMYQKRLNTGKSVQDSLQLTKKMLNKNNIQHLSFSSLSLFRSFLIIFPCFLLLIKRIKTKTTETPARIKLMIPNSINVVLNINLTQIVGIYLRKTTLMSILQRFNFYLIFNPSLKVSVLLLYF